MAGGCTVKVCLSVCPTESWWGAPARAAGDGLHASDVAWTLAIHCASLQKVPTAQRLGVAEAEHCRSCCATCALSGRASGSGIRSCHRESRPAPFGELKGFFALF